jgi:ABC-type branched-subunit amino acid transport system ATPase component/branched-subunit amino acid ABC-type transport system permease component
LSDVIRFAILGLGAGALYAIAAVGLVLVYRGSGVVNFAQGAMGMVGAYVFFETRQVHHVPAVWAVILGLGACAVLGGGFYLLVLRRMRAASTLAQIVATLALLVVIQDVIGLRYGPLPRLVTSMFPTGPVSVFGTDVGADRLCILGVVSVLTAVLWWVYRFTRFGVATSAVAENPVAAGSLGVSPHLIATLNWALGAALGGLAAILLVPITSLSSDLLSLIVIPILAAAVVGRFSSFPVTLAAGLGIGVAQSEVTRWVSTPGWPTAVPFLFVAVAVVRGRRISGRADSSGLMPGVGPGRPPPIKILAAAGVTLLLVWLVMPATWIAATEMQMVVVIVLLSFVVVTGYAGQASLAQMAFAGLGAAVAARMYNFHDWSMPLALLAGCAAMIPLGLLVGLAAVRVRGVQLAVVTLGLAFTVDALVLGNPKYSGGLGYLRQTPSFFGVDLDVIASPARYATLTMILLALLLLVVGNLRTGRAGRRLIAVRTNERAAMALGISVAGAKIYAFIVGGVIAAVAGVLIAFDPLMTGSGDQFAGLQSVDLMQAAVFGGVGHLSGPVIASFFQGGTLGQQVLGDVNSKPALYLSLVSGIVLLVILPVAPDGLASFVRRFARRRPVDPRNRPEPGVAVVSHSLRVEGLAVHYGGTVALDGLDLQVGPGEIVGLIGPNGSGKTSAIDAITGFTGAAAGAVTLGGREMTRWGPERRARHGLARSFQSLELFDDLTVAENMQTAGDRRDIWAYFSNLFHRDRSGLSERARGALRDFSLESRLGDLCRNLNYADRRLLAVARAVASSGSVMLLDEPASGLTDAQSRALSEVLARLAGESNLGVLLVEHNVDMVMSTCHRVVVLDAGRVIAAGTPAEVRADPAVIKAYLGAPRVPRAGPAARP